MTCLSVAAKQSQSECVHVRKHIRVICNQIMIMDHLFKWEAPRCSAAAGEVRAECILEFLRESLVHWLFWSWLSEGTAELTDTFQFTARVLHTQSFLYHEPVTQ